MQRAALMSGLLTWMVQKAPKAIGILAVWVAALSLVPPIGTLVNVLTAWRFGVIGHVYYEIGGNRLRRGSGDFRDLAFGDKLQAASEVDFHESDHNDSPTIFRLRQGDCVVVVWRDRELHVEFARSGGWLLVATTACGLFR